MAADAPSSPEEPLESFYGLDAEEVRRLAEAEAQAEATGPAAAGEPRARSEAGSGRKRTVTGALMAGIAMGFREVFEPEVHDRTAVEQPAPEQPLEPQKYEIHLDPVAPESSFAIYRPWVDGVEDPGDPGDPDTPGNAGNAGNAGNPDDPESPGKPDRQPAAADVAPRRRGGGAGALGG